jgi:hypothetical protein
VIVSDGAVQVWRLADGNRARAVPRDVPLSEKTLDECDS